MIIRQTRTLLTYRQMDFSPQTASRWVEEIEAAVD